MSYEMIALVMFVGMMGMLLTGQRVFGAIGFIAAFAALALWGDGGAELPFSAAMKLMKWYPLMTLPLFIYMGYIMSESRIADDLIDGQTVHADNVFVSEPGSGVNEIVTTPVGSLETNGPAVFYTDNFSGDGRYIGFSTIATDLSALDANDAAIALARKVQDDIAAAVLAAKTAADGQQVRVMFILSAQNGRILTSGTSTAADSIIQMAGGTNAITEFTGYKPVTDEAVMLAAPDVILMMAQGGAPISDEELFAIPALASSPAGQNRRVVRMGGLHLLGFGPRTGTAIAELSRALYEAAG